MKSKNITVKHIHNSLVIIGDRANEDEELVREVKDFDIANATPLQCFDFIRKLKNLFRKNGVV